MLSASTLYKDHFSESPMFSITHLTAIGCILRQLLQWLFIVNTELSMANCTRVDHLGFGELKKARALSRLDLSRTPIDFHTLQLLLQHAPNLCHLSLSQYHTSRKNIYNYTEKFASQKQSGNLSVLKHSPHGKFHCHYEIFWLHF